MHHEFDSNGNFEERSLWVHKVSVENSDQAVVHEPEIYFVNCSFTCLASVFCPDASYNA